MNTKESIWNVLQAATIFGLAVSCVNSSLRLDSIEKKLGPAQKTSSETGTTTLAPSPPGQQETVSIPPLSDKEIYHKTMTLDLRDPYTKEGTIYRQNLESGAVRQTIRENGKTSTRVDYLVK